MGAIQKPTTYIGSKKNFYAEQTQLGMHSDTQSFAGDHMTAQRGEVPSSQFIRARQ
jgi:hypothetical protein